MNSKEWKQYQLGDVVDLLQGLAINSKTNHLIQDSGLPLLRITDLLNDTQVQFIDPRKVPSQFIANENEIIYTRTGQVGYVFKGKRGVVHNNCFKVIPLNNEIDTGYLYWFLYQKSIREHANNIASGSVQKDLTHTAFKSINIKIPPLPTQRRIADILSALDDKIELNRQTNATLEAMAQAIFKEWFVDFNYPGATGELVDSELGLIPAGWRVGKLGELCRSKRQTVNPNDISPETPYVGLEHIPRKSLGLASWGIADDVGSQKTKFQKLDILFGKLRPYFHKVCIAPLDGICSTDILVIESFNRDMFSFCVNHLFSNEMIAYVSLIADGTRMPRVDWSSISNYEIVIPPESLLLQFNQIVFSFYEEIIENNYQSANLVQIRDTLLPKLMRGEIAV
jgi:type I restriction enzyme S subunit